MNQEISAKEQQRYGLWLDGHQGLHTQARYLPAAVFAVPCKLRRVFGELVEDAELERHGRQGRGAGLAKAGVAAGRRLSCG